ncbi:hypothetical protein EC991_009270 [Linnemannia zychae]|nr:hypothetical protein EC991_009270 [Linnemannia zychae]
MEGATPGSSINPQNEPSSAHSDQEADVSSTQATGQQATHSLQCPLKRPLRRAKSNHLLAIPKYLPEIPHKNLLAQIATFIDWVKEDYYIGLHSSTCHADLLYWRTFCALEDGDVLEPEELRWKIVHAFKARAKTELSRAHHKKLHEAQRPQSQKPVEGEGDEDEYDPVGDTIKIWHRPPFIEMTADVVSMGDLFFTV